MAFNILKFNIEAHQRDLEPRIVVLQFPPPSMVEYAIYNKYIECFPNMAYAMDAQAKALIGPNIHTTNG